LDRHRRRGQVIRTGLDGEDTEVGKLEQIPCDLNAARGCVNEAVRRTMLA